MTERNTPLLAQARRDIEHARQQFRSDVRALLKAAYEDGDAIADAIGTISVDEAYQAWAKKLRETLAR